MSLGIEELVITVAVLGSKKFLRKSLYTYTASPRESINLFSQQPNATPRSPPKELEGIYSKELKEGMDTKGYWKCEAVMEEIVQR